MNIPFSSIVPSGAFSGVYAHMDIPVPARHQQPAMIDSLERVNRSKHVPELLEISQEVVASDLPPLIPKYAQPERTSACIRKIREGDPSRHGRSTDDEVTLSHSEVNPLHPSAASLTVLPRTSKFLGVPAFCGRCCHDAGISIVPQ